MASPGVSFLSGYDWGPRVLRGVCKWRKAQMCKCDYAGLGGRVPVRRALPDAGVTAPVVVLKNARK